MKNGTKDKKIPTPEQQRVIDSRGQNLLVSASAGSGKTSTMIDRIAALICEGTSVTDILALTFTKAAAAEMREKLWNKLLALAASNDFLKKELADFPLASIGTIHSFCADLLRSNFAKAGVDPSFSVIEGSAQKILFADSLAETLENYYTENTPEFYSLLDAFGKKRTDKGLKNIIKKVYDCAINTSSPEEWLASSAARYDEKTFDEVAGKVNTQYTRAAEFYGGEISRLIFLCHTAQMAAHKAALVDLHGQISPISDKNTFETNYGLVLAYRGAALPRKSNKYDAELQDKIKAVKDGLTDTMEKFQAEFCGQSFESVKKEREQAAENARTLAAVTRKLKEVYDGKKSRVSVLDFSDLEHAVNKLLSDRGIREELTARYKFVFVDEYQDINELQEGILKKLSKDNNRFMVGDIKQSIYAFRHSDPEIIKARMNEFADGAGGMRVNLSHNFRSHPDILNFANFIFDNIMTDEFGGADYKNEHGLKYLAKESICDNRVSVDFITNCKNKHLQWNESMPMPYDINAEGAEYEASHAEAEALVIADKIAGLLTKGLSYRDIVILTRSQTAHAFGIFEKLKSIGIPVSFPAEKTEGGNAALLTLLNFMSVINNPLQDIPLAAVLGSFMYNFSAAELIEISLADAGEEADFFDKLNVHSKSVNGRKAKQFLGDLARYRQLAKSVPAAELLTTIINEKSAEKHIRHSSDGEVRAAALRNFVSSLSESERAATTESFCAYIELYGIDKVYEGSGGENAVRMLSVHASKGLEYPAVIFAGLGADEQHDRDEALVDKTSGISVKFYDAATRRKNRTLNYAAARIEGEKRGKEESLRILYVALTRAKEYLCLTGCINEFPEADSSAFDAYSLEKQNSFADLIAAVIANGGVNGFCLTKTDKSEITALLTPAGGSPVFPIKDEKLIAQLKKRMEYSYPFLPAVTLKYKMAASDAAKIIYADAGQERRRRGAEIFRGKKDEAERGRLTAETKSAAADVDTGTLYHKVLLYVDLSAPDVKGEIEKLVREGVLTGGEAAQIDTGLLSGLLSLDIMKRAGANPHFREQPFMMPVSAAEIAAGQEKDDDVIIQGIIDLMFFEKEDIIIVDYKYSSLSADKLKEAYSAQLKLYARAAETVLGRKVTGKYILSICSGESIEI